MVGAGEGITSMRCRAARKRWQWTGQHSHLIFFFCLIFGHPTAYGAPRPGIRWSYRCNLSHNFGNLGSSTHCAGRGSNLQPSAPNTPLIPLRHSGSSSICSLREIWAGLEPWEPSTQMGGGVSCAQAPLITHILSFLCTSGLGM